MKVLEDEKVTFTEQYETMRNDLTDVANHLNTEIKEKDASNEALQKQVEELLAKDAESRALIEKLQAEQAETAMEKEEARIKNEQQVGLLNRL